jgi:hypothetical protein
MQKPKFLLQRSLKGKRNPTFGIGIGVWWEVVVRIGRKMDVCLD